MDQTTLTNLKVTLRSKEHQLAKAREEVERLSHEYRSIRDTLAICVRETETNV